LAGRINRYRDICFWLRPPEWTASVRLHAIKTAQICLRWQAIDTEGIAAW